MGAVHFVYVQIDIYCWFYYSNSNNNNNNDPNNDNSNDNRNDDNGTKQNQEKYFFVLAPSTNSSIKFFG